MKFSTQKIRRSDISRQSLDTLAEIVGWMRGHWYAVSTREEIRRALGRRRVTSALRVGLASGVLSRTMMTNDDWGFALRRKGLF